MCELLNFLIFKWRHLKKSEKAEKIDLESPGSGNVYQSFSFFLLNLSTELNYDLSIEQLFS